MSDDTLQGAYETSEMLKTSDTVGVTDAAVIRITERDGKEVMVVRPNGDIFVHGTKVAEDEFGVVGEALMGWARESRAPDWIWEQLCNSCRTNIRKGEAVRRLGAEEGE